MCGRASGSHIAVTIKQLLILCTKNNILLCAQNTDITIVKKYKIKELYMYNGSSISSVSLDVINQIYFYSILLYI